MSVVEIEIVSVNVGKLEPISAKAGITGIFKNPLRGSVAVSKLGLAGDAIGDTQNHGGPDQAVYVYCQGDYDWWHSQEGLATHPGLFGENLTVSGMTTADAHVGARLSSDHLVLEVTAHRTPCVTFAVRMRDSAFPKRFWQSGRTGFYCRVIKEGYIEAGKRMKFEPFDGEIVSMGDLIAHYPYDKLDPETRKRFLATPLHFKMRKHLLRRR